MKKYNKDFIGVFIKTSLLVLFILLPKIPIAFSKLKHHTTSSTPKTNEKMYKSGVHTYRIDFNKESKSKTASLKSTYIDGQGIILKEKGTYSPSFNFRIREYCKDSIATFSTQTLISRLSNKNMDVIFVMTLEENNSDKSKWYGCYALNDNFKEKTWTILNGKHKIEDYVITENTYLKGYIWNKGSGEIAVNHLELILGIEPNINSKKPFIEILKPEITNYPSEIKTSIFKTKISGDIIGNVKIKTNIQQANCYNQQFIFCSESQLLVTDMNGKSIGKPISFKSNITMPCLNYSKSGMVVTSKKAKGNLLRMISISNDFKMIRDTLLKIPSSTEFIMSEGHVDSEANGVLGISTDAKIALLANNNFKISTLKIKLDIIDSYKITGLKQINKNKFIAIASNEGNNISYVGSIINGEIKFSLLPYLNDKDKSILGLDENATWISSADGNYFVLTNSIRKNLFKISLKDDTSISILKNYHLQISERNISPNYYEFTSMFKGKRNNGEGLYFNCHNSIATQKVHPEISNNILYFYKTD